MVLLTRYSPTLSGDWCYPWRCLLAVQVKIFSTYPPESIFKKPKHPLRGLLSDIGFFTPNVSGSPKDS
jgi:hypothetical protein